MSGSVQEPGPISPEQPIPPKGADIGGMHISPETPQKTRMTHPHHMPQHETKEIMSMGAYHEHVFPKTKVLLLEAVKGQNIPKFRLDSMFTMANAIDERLQEKLAHAHRHALDDKLQAMQKGKPLSSQEISTLSARIDSELYQKALEAQKYFVTSDIRNDDPPCTPIERMCKPFEDLQVPIESKERQAFQDAVNKTCDYMMLLAFDQHFENPEQYVSHGFDHSINVANCTSGVLALNESIVLATAKKYNITTGEAKFIMQALALFHDSGYPHVGCRGKAVHGISGADLVFPMKECFDALITSPNADKEMLFNDFRHSIMFHSADKVEYAFSAKIVSTQGTFLADLTDPGNIVTVIGHFYDPKKNPSNQPRFVTEVIVRDEEMWGQIEDLLIQAHEEELTKLPPNFDLSTLPKLPNVRIARKDEIKEFVGRGVDLVSKKALLGLQYSERDALDMPLQALIRIVDNMDMSKKRLTPLQSEPAFRFLYTKLGDSQGEISDLAYTLDMARDLENLWLQPILLWMKQRKRQIKHG